MKQEEIVNEVFSALEKKNWSKVEKQLSDDFTFSGALPKPITRTEWFGVQQALQSGVPDLRFNLHQVTVKGEKVTAKVKLQGTHTAEMPSPLPGVKSIPKTNKKIELPVEELEFTFKGNKISKLYVKPVPHGGFHGILEQLGVSEAVNQNLRVIQSGFTEYSKGNVQGVIDLCTTDVVWKTFDNPKVPFAGTYNGKDELKKFFTLLGEHLEVTYFEPKEFICEGENVIVLGHQTATVKKTGKKIDQDWCFAFKLRNEKIYHQYAYVDTRLAAEAFQ